MRSAALILPLALFACSGGDKGSDTGPTTSTTGTTPTGTATGTGTPTTGTPTGTATGTNAAPPVANSDSLVVDEGAGATVDPLANDTSDVGLSPLSLTLTSYPSHGTLQISPSGIGYTHLGSEDFSDAFTYTVDDALGQTSNEAQIAVTINPINDIPITIDDQATVDEGGTVQIDVAANDGDPDDALDLTTVVVVGQPSSGTATVIGGGVVEYVHDGTDGPVDGFTYTISDTFGAVSNNGAVMITVNNINDAPVANDDNLVVNPLSSNSVRVVNNDQDPDDGLDWTSITIVSQPADGTVIIDTATGAIEYTHTNPVYVTPSYDAFSYTIADNSGAVSNVATVNVTIDDYVPPVYVGSYQVDAGPAWGTNPPVATCREACATVFGGVDTDYQCSSSNLYIDNTARASSFGVGGCGVVADDFKADLGTGYDCGVAGCSTSAWVQDNCIGPAGTNHCWQ